ncbi:MAG: T9SS type A sorting domain-containing protein [Bacteroidota bacterium]
MPNFLILKNRQKRFCNVFFSVRRKICAFLLSLTIAVSVCGQDIPFSEDFSFFDGSGFDTGPSAGHLNSNVWRIGGLSGSSTGGPFGGDYDAKGSSTGGIASSGIYSFDVGSGNATLGVQPDDLDFNPGTITLRLQNNTGATVTSLFVSYHVYINNDEDRSNNFGLSYNDDPLEGGSYTSVNTLNVTSTAIRDATGFVLNEKSTIITGLNVANGNFFYLQWIVANADGSGSKDEFALDNVLVGIPPFPGGIAPAKSDLWYKPEGITSGGSLEWSNDAGNTAFDISQGTVANQPTLNNAINLINGNANLTFDGSSDYLSIAKSYASTSAIDQILIFTVFKTDFNGEINDNWAFLDFDRSEYFNFYLRGGGDLAFSVNGNTTGIAVIDGSTANLNDDVAHLGVAYFDNTQATDIRLFVDGSEETINENVSLSLNEDIGSANTRFGFIGDGSEAAVNDGARNNLHYDGEIAEIIFFENQSLSNNEIRQIETYLAIKYGITLSSGDYLSSIGTIIWDNTVNGSFQNGIVAVGNETVSGLDVQSSVSAEKDAYLTLSDNDLADGDFVVIGHDASNLEISASANLGFDREISRIWKAQVTSTNPLVVDQLIFDLSSIANLPSLTSDDFGLLVGGVEVTSGLVWNDLLKTLTVSDLAVSNDEIKVLFNSIVTTPGGTSVFPELWFRADAQLFNNSDAPVSNGDSIRTWMDQSGNFQSAIQSNTTEQPVYDEVNTMNGNPVVNFSGSAAHLPISGLSYNVTDKTLSALTIYSVLQSDQTDEGIIVSYDRSSFFRFALNHDNNGNYGLSTTTTVNLDNINSINNAADNVPHIIGAQYDATTDLKTLIFDGNTETFNNAHGGTAIQLGNSGEVPRFGYIGSGSEAASFDENNSPANFLSGNLAEVIYFQSFLDATNRAQVESYLAIKYGITLPIDYLSSNSTIIFSSGSYSNDIVGIGLDINATLDQLSSTSINSNAILTLTSNVSDALANGEYVIAGNDGNDLNIVTSEATVGGTSRFNRIWLFDFTGASTNVAISFDLSSVIIRPNDASDYVFLTDADGNFASGANVLGSSGVFDANGNILTIKDLTINGDFYLAISFNPDLDNDNIPDLIDIDDDNDGILDATELLASNNDPDGDGIDNDRDLDSDNDGIPDLYESGIETDRSGDLSNISDIAAVLDANGDGIIDTGVAVGTNGLADILETAADNGTIDYELANTDGASTAPDTQNDYLDLDSENNGLSDLRESGQDAGLDSNDNGYYDIGDTSYADADTDGIVDFLDGDPSSFGTNGFKVLDSDADGIANFKDVSNLDPVNAVANLDVVTLGLDAMDTDNDGALDGGVDSDNDGAILIANLFGTGLNGPDSDDTTFGEIGFSPLSNGSGTTWYSFQSGNWDNPDNWTLDASGTTRDNPDNRIPKLLTEEVVILNGDEMTLNFNELLLSSLEVEAGGILNIGSTYRHTFTDINGAGKIKIASNSLPIGDYTDFIAITGGTIQYEGTGYELSEPRTWNNFNISSTGTITLKSDLILNGNLNVLEGTLQINDNLESGPVADGFADNTMPLSININGNLTVDASGFITVGDNDASTLVPNSNGIFTFHQLEVLGDITNNGSISFTNLSGTSLADDRFRYKYPTAADADNVLTSNTNGAIPSDEFGVVEVLFTNTFADQLITCNGPTDFYRIEIRKGTSQTFTAEFRANHTSNFRLLGRIAMNMSEDSDDTPNIENHRALGLEGGILKLSDNIVIDEIAVNDPNGANPTTQGGNRNYIIDLDAQLWLSSNAVLNRTEEFARFGIHPFGKLKISDNAVLNASQSDILVDNQGIFEILGGIVTVNNFRTKVDADNAPRGSYIQTGGIVNITGEIGVGDDASLFDLPWQDQTFTLNASDPANPPTLNIFLQGDNLSKDNSAVQIGVKEGNQSIGVSVVNIIHTSGTNYKLNSTAPFYNLTLDATSTGTIIVDDVTDANDRNPSNPSAILSDNNSTTINSPAQFALPIIILNNLTIQKGVLDMNGNNLTIGNQFVIQDGGQYNVGLNNTTTFNGVSVTQLISLNGDGGNGLGPVVNDEMDPYFGFVNLETSGTEVTFITDNNPFFPITIANDLTINSGVILNDNGEDISIKGTINNSGVHITSSNPANAGSLILEDGTHEIGGDGTGIFNILKINSSSGAKLTANQTIDSLLVLQNGVLDIGTYALTINSTNPAPIRDDSGGTSNFGVGLNQYIQINGLYSDDGLIIGVTDAGTFTYPIGVSGKYTPATVSITTFNDDGKIQINPVNGALATLANPSTDSLEYYWRVRVSDFSVSPDASLTFVYEENDVVDDLGNRPGDESVLVPGYVNESVARVPAGGDDEDVNEGTNTINFPELTPLLPGNFTAGIATDFTGSVQKFYARQSGEWHDPETWAVPTLDTDGLPIWINPMTGPEGEPMQTEVPGAGDLVIIGWNSNGQGTGVNYQVVISNVRADGNTTTNYDNIDVAGVVILSEADGENSVLALDDDTSVIRNFGIVTNNDPDHSGTVLPGEVILTTGILPLGDFGTILNSSTTTITYSREFPGTDATIIDEDDETFTASIVEGYTIDPSTTTYPNLNFNNSGYAGGGGITSITLPPAHITVNGNLSFENGTNNVVLNDGSSGDVTVAKNIVFFSGDATLSFPGSSINNKRLNVQGDIDFNSNNSTTVGINAIGGASTVRHLISLEGSICNPGTNSVIDLVDGATTVDLEINGSSDATIDLNSEMDLHSIILNKGNGQAKSMTVNADFTLAATASGSVKPITMMNGTLILTNSNIDIDLNSGGGDFNIPATAGLNIQSGTVRVSATGTGSGNGFRLDGQLIISGGNLLLGNDASNGDNYIEYGSEGSAGLTLSSGNLVVGSQMRRSLLATNGTLNYDQTGGNAYFGVYAAPDDSRGVFELLNTSTFNLDLSSGGTFAIVESQATPLLGTLVFDENITSTIESSSIIDFGADDTSITGVTIQTNESEVYEINAFQTLANIRIHHSDPGLNVDPILKLVKRPLAVSGDIDILNSSTLQTNSFDLTVGGDFINNGAYLAGSNTTTFNGTTQAVGGTATYTYHNLVISATQVNLGTITAIDGDLTINPGSTLADGGNAITFEGALDLGGSITGTGGFKFAGTNQQTMLLSHNTATIDNLIVHNPNSVILLDNGGAKVELTIGEELAIENGIFNIGDNLLIISEDAIVTSNFALNTTTFDDSKYISLNGSTGSNGVTKNISSTEETTGLSFIYPVGAGELYSPVTLTINNADELTGVNVNPIDNIPPSNSGTDLLEYYWQVTSFPEDVNIASLDGSIAFQYDDERASEEDAGWDDEAARLLGANWIKPDNVSRAGLGGTLVTLSSNTFSFVQNNPTSQSLEDNGEDPAGVLSAINFDGDYTIGTDLPTLLPQYISNVGNNNPGSDWGLASTWIIDDNLNGVIDAPGESTTGIPTAGSTVIIAAGDRVNMAVSDNDQNVASLTINGTLDIGPSSGHGFGILDGSGVMVIQTSQIPGGNSDAFFNINTGGTLEVEGPNLPTGFTTVRGLTLSSGSRTTVPAGTFIIGDLNLIVQNNSTLDNTINNGDITVIGDIILGELSPTSGGLLLGTGSLTATNINLVTASSIFTANGGSINLSGSLRIASGATFNAGSSVSHMIEGDITLISGGVFNNGSGTITLDGNGPAQNIIGDYSSNPFFNLIVSNTNGLILTASDNLRVSNVMTLDEGNVTVASGGFLRLTNGVGSLIVNAGFIEGALQVDLTTNDRFTFPVGHTGERRDVLIEVDGASTDVVWQAEVFNFSAEGFTGTDNTYMIPVGSLSNIETPPPGELDQVVSINDAVYWVINTLQPDGVTPAVGGIASELIIDLSNQGASQDEINNDDLQVMVWNNSSQQWDHLGGVVNGVPSSATIASTLNLTFTEKVITSGAEDSESSLPVELLSFSGEIIDNVTRLEWETATEINNDYFEVQHSLDGVEFEVVGIVDGNGNSNELISYDFTHRSPSFGANYYRLRQVDFDGEFEIHTLLRLMNDFIKEGIDVIIYPNPGSAAKLYVKILSGDDHTPINVSISNLTGKIFYQRVLSGGLNIDEALEMGKQMTPGVYLVEISQGANTGREKLVIK